MMGLPEEDRAAPQAGGERLPPMRGKWIPAHPQREAPIPRGAFPGLLGGKRQLLY